MSVKKNKFILPVIETKTGREIELEDKMNRMEQLLATVIPGLVVNEPASE